MAEDKLVFPVEFDLDSGADQAIADWDSAQKKIQSEIDKDKLEVKITLDKDTSEVSSKWKSIKGGMEQALQGDPLTVRLAMDDNAVGQIDSSINGISNSMKLLVAEWNKMPSSDKFLDDGSFTEKAKAIIESFTTMTASAQVYGKTLKQIASEAVKEFDAQEKAEIKAIQTRQDAWDKYYAAARKYSVSSLTTESTASADDRAYYAELESLAAEKAKQDEADIKMAQKRETAWEKFYTTQRKLAVESLTTDTAASADDRAYYAELEQLSQKRITQLNKENQARQANYNLVKQQGMSVVKVLAQEETSIDAINAKLRIQMQRLQSSDLNGKKFEKIAAEVKRLNTALTEAQTKLQVATGQVGVSNASVKNLQAAETSTRNMASYTNVLIQRWITYNALTSTINFAKNIRDTTAEFELQRVSLGALIQDAERANQLFEQIKTAAVESPFEIKDLVTYTKQLAAYGFETEELFDTMNSLADVSAGIGVGMDRIILAYGQVAAKGHLAGTELKQFTEAGIALVPLLAEKFTELQGQVVTTAEVYDMISNKEVTFGNVEQVFDDLTSAGGRFYDMQKIQAQTLSGMYSNLKDSISIAYDEMGRDNRGTLVDVIKLVKTLWENWETVYDTLKVVGIGYGSLVVSTKVLNSELVKTNVIYNTQTNSVKKLATAWNVLKVAAVKAGAAIKTALASTVITVAIGATVTAIFKLIAANKEAKQSLLDLKMQARDYADELKAVSEDVNKALSVDVESDELSKSVATLKDIITQNKDLNPLVEERLKNITDEKIQLEELRKIWETINGEVDGGRSSLERNLTTMQNASTSLGESLIKGNLQKYLTAYQDSLDEVSQSVSGFIDTEKGLDAEWAKPFLQSFEQIREEGGSAIDVGNIIGQNSWNLLYETTNSIYWTITNTQNKIKSLRSGTNQWLSNYINEVNKLRDADDQLTLGEVNLGVSEDSFKGFQTEFVTTYGKFVNQIKDINQEGRIALTKEINTLVPSLIPTAENITAQWSASGWRDAFNDMLTEVSEGFGGFTDAAEEVIASGGNAFSQKMQTFDNTVLNSLKRTSENQSEGWTDVLKSIQTQRDSLVKELAVLENIPLHLRSDDTDTQISKLTENVKVAEILYQRLKAAIEAMGSGSAKNPRIAELQSEVTLVEAVYKKYKEYLAYMTEAEARAEILANYGEALSSVKIDGFDDPMEIDFSDEGLKEFYDKVKAEYGSLEEYIKARAIQVKMGDVDFTSLKTSITKELAKLTTQIEQQQVANDFFTKMLGITGDSNLAMSMTMSVYGDVANSVGEEMAESMAEKTRQQIITAFGGDKMSEGLRSAIESTFDKVANTIDYSALRGLLGDLELTDDLKEKLGNIDLSTFTYDMGDASILDVSKLIDSKDVDQAVKDMVKTLTLIPSAQSKVLATILKNGHKSQEQILIDYANTAKEFETLTQKINNINLSYVQKIETIQKGLSLQDSVVGGLISGVNVSEEGGVTKLLQTLEDIPEKTPLVTNAIATINSALASQAIEVRKLTPEYLQFFTSIAYMNKDAASAIRQELRAELFDGFSKGALSADELREELEAIEKQFSKLSTPTNKFFSYMSGGYDGLMSNLTGYANEIDAVAGRISKATNLEDVSDSDKSFVDKLMGDQGGLQGMFDKFGGNMGKVGSQISSVGSSMQGAIGGAMGVVSMIDAIVQAIDASVQSISAMLDELNRMRSEENQIGGWFDYIEDVNKYAVSAWESLKSGDGVGTITNVVSAVASIFNNIQERKVEDLNDEIEYQAELIEDLQDTFEDLARSMEKFSLGSDWVDDYNDQIENLEAQAEAARAQYEAEMAKGKSSDSDAAEEYWDNYEDYLQEAAELAEDFAEEMIGYSFSDFAKNIASIWLEAKVAGEDTMAALSDEYDSLMQDMVANTILAAALEASLQPVFDKIDEMRENTDLAEDPDYWASFGTTLSDALAGSDAILENVYAALEAAGVSLTSDSSDLEGIAKNISTASEEAVLGLSAGVATQNYYMATISAQVTDIRALMDGSVTASDDPLILLQNTYLAELPNIALNTANTVAECRNVVAQLAQTNATLDVMGTKVGAMQESLDSVIQVQAITPTKMLHVKSHN